MTAIKQRIQDRLEAAFPELEQVEIEIPDDPEHGAYATNAAMQAASQAGEQPRQYAEQKAEQLRESGIDGVTAIEVAGPGFINFSVDRQRLGSQIVDGIRDQEHEAKDEKIVVEHTSPNPNKPLHMGTMRCAILGDTVARIADFLGYEVEVQDYINDLGRSTAQTVFAYQEFRDDVDDDDMEEKDDFWIGQLYSRAGQYLEDHPDEEDRIQEIIRKTEEGGNDIAALKDEVVEQSLRGQLQTAYRTNIFYDVLPFERDVVDTGLLEEVKDKLLALDSCYEVEEGEDEGCIVIDLSRYEDKMGSMKKPYKILFRSDGTATYTAKDIAVTLWKFGLIEAGFGYELFDEQPNGEELWSTGGDEDKSFGDADQVINVVGAPQSYVMKVIKYSLKALGYEEAADRFHHLDFKFVYLPGRVAYSGRKGNWVGKHGDAVLDRSKELAREEIDKRHDDLDGNQREVIADKVAVAAVRYFVLQHTREKEVHFSFEKALDWDGDSGPYLLYSAARAHGILEKADGIEGSVEAIEDEATYDLLRELERFDDVVAAAFATREPASLATYLKDLSESFNTFYHNCPVLDAATGEQRRTRYAAVAAFVAAMETGLELLGIRPLEEM